LGFQTMFAARGIAAIAANAASMQKNVRRVLFMLIVDFRFQTY